MMDRREFMASAGVGAFGIGLGTGVVTSQDRRRIDVVDDLGVDDTGETAIDDTLAPHLRDGTRLEFPDGRYRIDQVSLYRRQNFAMVATGDATLVPGDYPSDDVWIGGGAVRDLRFEGFTLDTNGTGPTIGFSAYDDLLVRDIDKVGAHTTTRTAFGFEIWEPGGSGLVAGLRARDGDVFRDSVGANAVYSKTRGTVTFRDLELAEWSDNGLYASDATGPVQVEGGYFANNNVSQVRLSSPGSYVRGATIVVDRTEYPRSNFRGIRVNDGPGPVTIEDTQILLVRGKGNGGIVVSDDGGTVTVRNSRIFVEPGYQTPNPLTDQTGYAIQVDSPVPGQPPRPFVLRQSAITGGGRQGGAVLLKRSDSLVEGACINQTGTRDGIIVAGESENNRIVDSTVAVPGDPVVRRSGSVVTERLSLEGTCRVPDTVTYEQFGAAVETETPTTESTPTTASTAVGTTPATPGTEPTTTSTTADGFGPVAVLAGIGLGSLRWMQNRETDEGTGGR